MSGVRTFTTSRSGVTTIHYRESWDVALDAARRRVERSIEISAVQALGRHENRCNALRVRQEFRFDRVERAIAPRMHRYRMRDYGVSIDQAALAFAKLAAAATAAAPDIARFAEAVATHGRHVELTPLASLERRWRVLCAAVTRELHLARVLEWLSAAAKREGAR